jgi:hypothetical protein
VTSAFGKSGETTPYIEAAARLPAFDGINRTQRKADDQDWWLPRQLVNTSIPVGQQSWMVALNHH